MLIRINCILVVKHVEKSCWCEIALHAVNMCWSTMGVILERENTHWFSKATLHAPGKITQLHSLPLTYPDSKRYYIVFLCYAVWSCHVLPKAQEEWWFTCGALPVLTYTMVRNLWLTCKQEISALLATNWQYEIWVCDREWVWKWTFTNSPWPLSITARPMYDRNVFWDMKCVRVWGVNVWRGHFDRQPLDTWRT